MKNLIEKFLSKIGTTKQLTHEGISMTERFQKVFLRTYENIEKTPKVIKNLYISNVIRRTFTHILYRTIDDSKDGFHLEKTTSEHYEVHTYTDQLVDVDLNRTHISRSRGITLTMTNIGQDGDCEAWFVGNMYSWIIPRNSYGAVKIYLTIEGDLHTIRFKNHATNNAGWVFFDISYTPLI